MISLYATWKFKFVGVEFLLLPPPPPSRHGAARSIRPGPFGSAVVTVWEVLSLFPPLLSSAAAITSQFVRDDRLDEERSRRIH